MTSLFGLLGILPVSPIARQIPNGLPKMLAVDLECPATHLRRLPSLDWRSGDHQA